MLKKYDRKQIKNTDITNNKQNTEKQTQNTAKQNYSLV